jgi:hypothetical protein
MLMMLICREIVSTIKRDVEVIIASIKEVFLEVNTRKTK